MFETLTITKPFRYGHWKDALKYQLWCFQLTFSGDWRKVDVSLGGD